MTEQSNIQHGRQAVEAIFTRAKAEGRAAFLPYFAVGYPNYEDSLAAIEGMAAVGVDAFEVGVPFSDPLADGPTVQVATQVALENGIRVRHCIEAVRELRGRGVEQPMLLMSYINPLLAYGLEQFVVDSKSAGADGFIVPDLPPEEAGELIQLCDREGMALVFFLAPTSSTARIKLVGQAARGFIYCVSLTGITGVRNELAPGVPEFIARIRAETNQPLVLGFGISTPAHARMMHDLVDGFIVGSALVRAGGESVEAVIQLASSLRMALN